MSTRNEKQYNDIKSTILSVANKEMDIEPEDNYSSDPVYCLKHKYLTKGEYWMGSTDFDVHDGIRIHKTHTKACPRRNFVDLFKSVNSFNDSQARYIAKTVAYLIELIAPIEQEIVDNILDSYVYNHKQYCFNYYTSVSHEQHFYVVDGYVKFDDDALSEYLKLSFEVYRDGFEIRKDIHFYLMGKDLVCSAKMKGTNTVVVDRNQDHRELACKILAAIMEPLLKDLDYGHEAINPINVKSFFEKMTEFKQLKDMVEI